MVVDHSDACMTICHICVACDILQMTKSDIFNLFHVLTCKMSEDKHVFIDFNYALTLLELNEHLCI